MLIDFNINSYSDVIELNEIKEFQRNRFPLLLLDKVLEHEPGKSVLGLKTFTYNEWFFPPHYDEDPNVPGFIQIECMIQSFIMTFLTLPEHKGDMTNCLDVNNVKFRRKILPGDSLFINAELKSFKRGIAKGHIEGYVFDDFACSADLVVALPEVVDRYTPR